MVSAVTARARFGSPPRLRMLAPALLQLFGVGAQGRRASHSSGTGVLGGHVGRTLSEHRSLGSDEGSERSSGPRVPGVAGAVLFLLGSRPVD